VRIEERLGHAPIALAAAQLRRGTHVNALGGATLDEDLARIATVVREREGWRDFYRAARRGE